MSSPSVPTTIPPVKAYQHCNPWCIPQIILIVLFFLSLIGILVSRAPGKSKLGAAFVNLILFGIVGVIIYFLCRSCHSGWSWVVLVVFVLLPVIIMLVLLFTVFAAASAVAAATR